MKRLAAIILSTLILFSFTACDFSNHSHESETSTSTDSDESAAPNTDNTETDESIFISREEKNTWKSQLIYILSRCEIQDNDLGISGSVAAGLMDLDFDNMPEVILAYPGGSMGNAPLEIYDLNTGEKLASYNASRNVYFYIAQKGDEFVLLNEGSIRITGADYVRSISMLIADRNLGSDYLYASSLFRQSNEGEKITYEYIGEIVDKEKYDTLYQQFLIDYIKIQETQIQLIKWETLGKLEWKDFGFKEGVDPESKERLAEKMADALITSSQEFINNNNENTLRHFSNYESILDTYRFSIDHYVTVNRNHFALIGELGIKSIIEKQLFIELDTAGYLMYPGRGAKDFDSPHYKLSCGYAIKDLNGDGINELVLLNDDYKIVAIFSTFNGSPVLLGSFSPRSSCWIGGDGLLHLCGSNGAENSSHKVCRIAEDGGELITIIEFGIDGSEIVDGNEILKFYKTVDGEKISIPEEEYLSISTQYGKYLGTYAGPSATKEHSGLNFIPLFDEVTY